MRNHTFEIGEYYHIYNRGSDKRDVILDSLDLQRFFQSIIEFNVEEPIKSIYLKNLKKYKFKELSTPTTQKLVSIVAYCINENHFHLILSPLVKCGVEKFMQRIGGYTRYFNEKYKRSGVLFQGKFKSKIIKNNNYLLNLSAYVNFNNMNSDLSLISDLTKSSLCEYQKENINGICNKEIILSNFKNKNEYFEFAKYSWTETLKRKEEVEFE